MSRRYPEPGDPGFGYEIRERNWLSEIAVRFPGGTDEAIGRLEELYDLALHTVIRVSGENPGLETIPLLRIAVAIDDDGLTDSARIGKALEIWKGVGELQKKQWEDSSRKIAIQENHVIVIDPSKPDPSPSRVETSYYVDLVAQTDFSQMSFDEWLKYLMPTRKKKADRLRRLRMYFAEKKLTRVEKERGQSGNELTDSRLEEIRRVFESDPAEKDPESGRFELTNEEKRAKESVPFFMWDDDRQESDRATRGKRGASRRWGKNPKK